VDLGSPLARSARVAAGAITAGLAMQSKFNSLDKSCGDTSGKSSGCSQSEIDSVSWRGTTANILWGLAAAGAVDHRRAVLFRRKTRERRAHGGGHDRIYRDGEVLVLNALSFPTVRLGIPGFCLIAALTAACSFDARRLRASALHAEDGPWNLSPRLIWAPLAATTTRLLHLMRQTPRAKEMTPPKPVEWRRRGAGGAGGATHLPRRRTETS